MASRPTGTAIAFYESLRTMVRAGLPLGRSLGLAAEKSTGRFGRAVADLERTVQGGIPLHEAMAGHPGEFPALERALVRAGETGGRLEECLGEILRILYRRRDSTRQVIQAAVYPVILVHAAILVPPTVTWFLRGFGAYLLIVVPTLAVVYGAAFALWLLGRLARTHETFGAWWGSAGLRVPWVGGIAESSSLARFARCLGALQRSGLTVLPAMDLSLQAIGNAEIRRRLQGSVASVEGGETLSEAIAKTRAFPREMEALIETGEKSGAIDECLDRVADILDDQAAHSLATLGKVLPVFFLILAMGFAVYQLLGQFADTFGNLGGLAK